MCRWSLVLSTCVLLLLWGTPSAFSEPVPLRPDGRRLRIEKVNVADAHVVRGFLAKTVDGTVHSLDYRGTVREYPKTASDGIVYAFNGNDGAHIRFADADGFDLVVLRGRAKARLYVDTTSLTEPKDVDPIWVFDGGADVQIGRFPRRVRARSAHLFGVTGGALGDVSFYRIERMDFNASSEQWGPSRREVLPDPTSEYDVLSIERAMRERYDDERGEAFLLEPGAADTLAAEADMPMHFVTPVFKQRQGLAAIDLDIEMTSKSANVPFTVVVQDPLSPRLDVTWIELVAPGSGTYRLRLDIPDQVLLEGSRLWITLLFRRAVEVAPAFRFAFVPIDRAMPEALAWRKLLMKSYFSLLSEPRRWGAYTSKMTREEFYSSSTYAAQCARLFTTIDEASALAPDDPLVRQYREWVFLRRLKMLDELPDVEPPPTPPEGVPPWAWYPRLAWLEVRRIAEWWLDHRLVPTGEFGGAVGDDTDMYQQYVDLVFFEREGVAARLKDAAARLAELAERNNLRNGLNRRAMDSLHAYEEGINHLALMTRWFYGDPVYFERAMESARNMEALTIVTEDGRRHFRTTERMGAGDLEKPREPTRDGFTNPLMWHTALQIAEYNRNPTALRLVREWADTWLRFQKPGEWATSIDVRTGKVLRAEKDRPLYGGYSTQGSVFTWLADLTDDLRYIEPFLYYYRQGRANYPSDRFLADVAVLGGLDGLDAATLEALSRRNPLLPLYLRTDPTPLVEATIGRVIPATSEIDSLYTARRWPDMYTKAEQFTDRIFPSLLRFASMAYLGGYTLRNKMNPTQAVRWRGFGTDYAALVLANRRDRVKAAVYSYADAPMAGEMMVWRLEHGRYRVTIGVDIDGDFEADRIVHEETQELARAGVLSITLPPKGVLVVEATQIERLDPIVARADLAVSKRETVLRGDLLSGVVHNIGSAEAREVVIAVVDETGKSVVQTLVGSLAAPTDLQPKRAAFELRLPERPQRGWALVVDPTDAIPEITERNNRISLANVVR